MKLINTLSLLIGSSHALYSHVRNSNMDNLFEKNSNILGGQIEKQMEKNNFEGDGHINLMNIGNPGGRTGSGYDTSLEDNDDTNGSNTKSNEYVHFNQGMGAVASKWKEEQAEKREKEIKDAEKERRKRIEQGLEPLVATGRSTSSGVSMEIITPSQAISEAHDENVMILSSDYMFVSNCLLKNRNANDPIRQQAFELFKQTAAGDWFIVFGYVCNVDYKCWKKNVQNLLIKKGDEFGGLMVGRCVGRLVREKAEGLRAKKRKRRNTSQHINQNNNHINQQQNLLQITNL